MKNERTEGMSLKRAVYEKPYMDILKFDSVDIMATTLSVVDPNQGEWDPQNGRSLHEGMEME